MTFVKGTHVPDDDLELYALGTLRADKTEALEEHLLVCAICQDRQQEYDHFVASAKTAMNRLEAEERAKARTASGGGENLRFFESWIGRPAWLAGAVAAVVLAVALTPQAPRHMNPQGVELASWRGESTSPEPRIQSRVSSGRPLTLTISPKDIPPAPNYRIDVVDSTGRLVLTMTPTLAGDRLSGSAGRGLARGQYWVRLYDGTSTDLLREFSLVAE